MMALKIRRNGGVGRTRRPRMLFVWAAVAFMQLLVTRSDVSHAFQPASYASLRSLSSTDRQRLRPKVTLFAKEDDDDERPTNDLDIFGQPKGKKWKVDDDEGEIRGTDRIKSCIPYILPLIDGDNFGKYIYERIPLLGNLDYVLLRPIVEGFNSAPFLNILLFMAFALGPQLFGSLSREVRFNAQQAVLIDVAILLPTILGEAVADADADLPRAIMEPSSNFVWFAYVSLVAYCVASNLRGKKPDQIPFISGTAEYVIGPF